jgi:mono/diheme cytochrome c family protein
LRFLSWFAKSAQDGGGQRHFPAPQLLDKEDMVTDDPVGESFWKVKNGIRLSGMPGFKESLSETQMWQVSALLAKADQLAPEVTAKLQPKSMNMNTPIKQ